MKKVLTLLLALAMLCSFAACAVNPGTTTSTPGSTTTAATTPEPTDPQPTEPQPTDPQPTDPWAEYEIITVAEALQIAEKCTTTSAERYYIRGVVSDLTTDYGSMTITDATGSIYVYGTYGADGVDRYSALEKKPVNGDEVLLYGNLQNYNGKMEIHSGWIIDFIPGKGGEVNTDMPAFDSDLTIAQVLALPIADGVQTSGKYYIDAMIVSVDNAAYGAMYVSDASGKIYVYNTIGYADMDVKPGRYAEVRLYAAVKNFGGTLELHDAQIISYKITELDTSKYKQMTIAEARNAEKGDLVRVSGVVAQVAYATGMKPTGIILVDNTASIYVYDSELAASVQQGDKITVGGAKTMWVLGKEQTSADKYGYKGCNQLEDAYLLSRDDSAAYDASWIEETTVKAIMQTPVSTDITGIVYKVTALVDYKDEGSFKNVYIYDLDGQTGSYCYTQANGADLAWLEKFDNKVCTVYMVALNAKSTSAGCTWRFLTLAAEEIAGYTWTDEETAKYAVDYVAVDQFKDVYTVNPNLELATVASSALMNKEGITISYASSDETVISVADNKLVCLKDGTVTITITASYNGAAYSKDVTVTYKEAVKPSAVTVKEAISTALNQRVTVEGIVGPSLVNRTGFYLMNDDGMIAVLVDNAEALEDLHLGDHVVLTGVRDCFNKALSAYMSGESNVEPSYWGQTCISKAVIDWNAYGNHTWDTSWYITDGTAADFKALSVAEDHCSTVYTLKAVVKYTNAYYYTAISLVCGDVTIELYCSSGEQYSWLAAFDGQEVTVDVAACNWNDKTFYKGCVLRAVDAEGNEYYNKLNLAE